MAIPKDTKDWTWVLDRPCLECGFDTAIVEPSSIGRLLRENVAAWEPLLASILAPMRPSDEIWSALEYGCHVRDVFRVYLGRLDRMLAEDDPLYPNWDQDATAVEERYGEQSPTAVSEQLRAAGDLLAERFDQVQADQWERTGRRSDGARFTVESFSRYLIHDPIHHLYDVRTGFETLGVGH
jgi:hypothetical protein